MAKMGWKAGQGLGKYEQGIKAPLEARKTKARTGVIVLGAVRPPPRTAPAAAPAARLPAGATRVLLLKNVVGPGAVDDALEDEVAEECERHGAVVMVKIFEHGDARCPPEEAVRVFVEFREPAAAAAARAAMDGRFFGGRAVRARFFDPGLYERNELQPDVDEF